MSIVWITDKYVAVEASASVLDAGRDLGPSQGFTARRLIILLQQLHRKGV